MLKSLMTSPVNTLKTWEYVFDEYKLTVNDQIMRKWFVEKEEPTPEQLDIIISRLKRTTVANTQQYQEFLKLCTKAAAVSS